MGRRSAERPRAHRPCWATGLALFCAATVVFLAARDLLVADVRDTEVWLGFELRGWPARITAPLHWAIFGAGAWGYWHVRPWVWPWASVYALYVAASHGVWNLTSPSGGGASAAAWQLALFAIAAVALLYARPPATR